MGNAIPAFQVIDCFDIVCLPHRRAQPAERYDLMAVYLIH
jgi:hypothetical protein